LVAAVAGSLVECAASDALPLRLAVDAGAVPVHGMTLAALPLEYFWLAGASYLSTMFTSSAKAACTVGELMHALPPPRPHCDDCLLMSPMHNQGFLASREMAHLEWSSVSTHVSGEVPGNDSDCTLTTA